MLGDYEMTEDSTANRNIEKQARLWGMLYHLATINLVLVIIAALRANAGDIFRYPFTIRFIK